MSGHGRAAATKLGRETERVFDPELHGDVVPCASDTEWVRYPIKINVVNSMREPEPPVSASAALKRALRADEGDVGCERVPSILHVYVDLIAAGERAAESHPGISTHLRSRDACREDHEGLLACVREP